MFFVLAKTIGSVAAPSNLFILLGLLGAALAGTRYARTGARLMVVSTALIAFCGFSPIGTALIVPLEQRFPPWDSSRGPPNGVVVLGGMIDPRISHYRGVPELTQAADRLTAVVELARRYPGMRLVFSGGSGQLWPVGRSEAELAGELIGILGVPRSRLILEDRSRNTAENAYYSKAIAAPKDGERWLLVTSAFHMPRAVGAFRRAEFPVEPYPVDWATAGTNDLLGFSSVLGGGLAATDHAVHEWTGLLAYWLAGHTSELFPGPDHGPPAR